MRPLILLGLVACGSPIDGQVWSGSCDDAGGAITITTGTLSVAPGPLDGVEGEHEAYRGSADLAFPGDTQDASVDFVVCLDADGCSDGITDVAEDQALIFFRNAADALVVVATGDFDKPTEVSGNCKVFGGPNQPFSFARLKE